MVGGYIIFIRLDWTFIFYLLFFIYFIFNILIFNIFIFNILGKKNLLVEIIVDLIIRNFINKVDKFIYDDISFFNY